MPVDPESVHVLSSQSESESKAELFASALEAIAELAHEVNRAYCQSTGDDSQLSWPIAPDWQKDSARAGVRGIRDGEILSPRDAHESWCQDKRASGWRLGPIKDPATREHPCLVPYDDLPDGQRVKDALYFTVVRTVLKLARQGN